MRLAADKHSIVASDFVTALLRSFATGHTILCVDVGRVVSLTVTPLAQTSDPSSTVRDPINPAMTEESLIQQMDRRRMH